MQIGKPLSYSGGFVDTIGKAHKVGAKVLIDGAQATPHIKPDMQALDVDYYTCSAHKICGPTGVGMLYGKRELLEELPPYQGGGEMIDQVTFEKTTYAGLPNKFEAGTPNICGGIAFGRALDYMNEIILDQYLKRDQVSKLPMEPDEIHISSEMVEELLDIPQ